MASAAADVLEDGVKSARRAAKQCGYAVAEFIDDTRRRVKRYPNERPRGKPRGIAAGHRERAASDGEFDPEEIKTADRAMFTRSLGRTG